MDTTLLIKMCQELSSMPKSFASGLWYMIQHWPWQLGSLFVIISLWVLIEIVTRYGTLWFHSENGFTPMFNRFVGSGTYIGLQALLLGFFSLISSTVYCTPWPYVLHILIFISTSKNLNKIGFWVYEKSPNTRKKRRWKRY